MDPITLAFVTALTTGLAAGASQQITSETYSTLKNIIKRKFGGKSEIANAIDNLEKKPISTGRQQTLHEEVIAIQLDKDIEILNLAQTLLDRINADGVNAQQITNFQYVVGDGNDVKFGIGGNVS